MNEREELGVGLCQQWASLGVHYLHDADILYITLWNEGMTSIAPMQPVDGRILVEIGIRLQGEDPEAIQTELPYLITRLLDCYEVRVDNIYCDIYDVDCQWEGGRQNLKLTLSDGNTVSISFREAIVSLSDSLPFSKFVDA